MSDNPKQAASVLRRTLRQPTFVIAMVVLLVAAVGLNATTQYMQLYFKKAAVPPARRALNLLPPQMGDWVQVSEDEKLNKETQDVLGTERYIYRDYANVQICGQDAIDAIKAKSGPDRKEALIKLQGEHPDGVINLGQTYYTGLADTVAHIPDRCYIADGFEPTDYTTPTWPVGKDAQGRDRELEVRFINFQDQTGAARINRSVAYLFHVDGHYESDPLAVRRRLQSLVEKYGYYSKIELMTLTADQEKSARGMQSFLAAALPELEKSFPDWEKLNARTGPESRTSK